MHADNESRLAQCRANSQIELAQQLAARDALHQNHVRQQVSRIEREQSERASLAHPVPFLPASPMPRRRDPPTRVSHNPTDPLALLQAGLLPFPGAAVPGTSTAGLFPQFGTFL